MLSIQQMASIAARYFTTMADAMITACVARAVETGEPLKIPERKVPVHHSHKVAVSSDDADWERMVNRNSDTRWNHV